MKNRMGELLLPREGKTARRVLWVILGIVLALWGPAPVPAAAPKKTVKVEFPVSNKQDTYKLSAVYTDDFFRNSSRKEQPDLAFLSALATATTYDNEAKINYTRKMLKSCGFDTAENFLFSKTGKTRGKSTLKDNDHARAQFGFRVIFDAGKRYLVAAVVISGYTGTHAEWVSNFNLGTGKTVAGFSAAADEMYGVIRKRVERYRKLCPGGVDGVRYWITGHSRGAAIADLVGRKLTKNCGRKNVYVYGFATPNVSRKVTRCPNIHHYVIREDFVPFLAPADWGYQRNGTTTVLKTTAKSAAMFQEIEGKTYRGFTWSQVKKFAKKFLKMTGGQAGYYRDRSRTDSPLIPAVFCQNGIAYVMNTDSRVKIKGLQLLSDYAARDARCENLYGSLFEYTLGGQISNTHMTANYLAVLMTR